MLSNMLSQENGKYSLKTKLFLLLLLVLAVGPPDDPQGPKKGKTPKDPAPVPVQPDPDNPRPQPREGLLFVEGGRGRGRSRGRGPSRGPGRHRRGLDPTRLFGTPEGDGDTPPDSDEEEDGDNLQEPLNTRKNLEDLLRDFLDSWEDELEKLRGQLAERVHQELFNC